MSKNNNKEKGKKGERDLSLILSQIFVKNFERVPNSGAFTGGKNSFRKEKLEKNQIKLFEGDIIIPENFKKNVVFEVKFYKKLPIDQLIYNEIKSPLKNWLEKYFNDEDTILFLCIKQNHKPWIVIFEEKRAENFLIEYFCKFYYNEKNFYVTHLVSFFEQNKSFFIE